MAIATAAITTGSVKPRAPASIAPKVNAPIATTAVTNPKASNGASRRSDCSARAASMSAARPTGMLMRKISRHDTSVSSPPNTGAEDEAIAPPIAQVATACALRVGSA